LGTTVSKPIFKSNRTALALAGAVILLTAGCASQPVVSNFPDLRIDQQPAPVLLTPNERNQAIEDLQNAAEKNQSG